MTRAEGAGAEGARPETASGGRPEGGAARRVAGSNRPAAASTVPTLPRRPAPTAAPLRSRERGLTSGAHPVSWHPPEASAAPRVVASPPSGRVGVGASLGSPALVERFVADRQLVVGTVGVLLLSRLIDGPETWAVPGLLGLGVLAGAGWSRVSADGVDASGDPSLRGRWEAVLHGAAGVESGAVPGVLAASLVLALRLVPFDWRLVIALVPAFVLLDRTIALERSLAVSTAPDAERWKAALAALAAAFIGFVGVASMIAGGLASAGGPAIAEPDLLLLAGVDGALAAVLGFRLVRLGPATRREAAISGAGYAALVAIGAGLLRAMAIPQLLGPALLTLLVYLWDALNGTTPSFRRDPRWRWQVALLLVLAAVVTGWNLRLRG